MQMIMYMSEIFDNLISKTLATMYLDFRKAFDKVSHGKFLGKLTNQGIKGGVLELIESYLKGRMQKDKVRSSVQLNLLCEVKSHKELYLDLYFLAFLFLIFHNMSCQHALDMRLTISL